MSFAKLDSGIVNSTIWVQPHDVLRVWVWFLSQADANGVVRTAAPALAHACMVPLDRMREIVALLEAPDPDSRSSVEDGRRIEKIEGGWAIVNYRTYRERVSAEEKREADRRRIAQKRAEARKESGQVDGCSDVSHPVAEVAQEEEEEEEEKKQKKEQGSPHGSRLPADWALPAKWRDWAASWYPDIDLEWEAAKFADYWHAVAGAKGRKADWLATWRNWIRGAGAPRGTARAGPRGAGGQQQIGKTAQGLMALEAMKSGNRMAAGRTADGVPKALLLGPGAHPSG